MAGFLDDVKEINPMKTYKGSGSFLDDIKPFTERQIFVNTAKIEAERAQKEKERMNSFGFIVKETAKDTAMKPVKAVESFATNTWNTYKQTPHLLLQDINDAADNMAKGEGGKALFKGGVRTAYHVANAIFAPISAAIGAALEQTGGQKLIDKAGETIADKSGITDLPRFQKFAMEHPNAAEDFNGIMMLVMAGMEKSPINVTKLPGEVNKFVSNIVKPAKIVETPVKSLTPNEVSVPVSTPKTRYQKYLDEQGYEPYKSPENLPTIDMGKPVKDSLPTIQVGESVRISRTADGEYRYEPISNIKETKPVVEAKPTPEPQPKIVNETPKQELPPNKEISSQAKEIAQTLDTEFNINVSPEDLATYKTKQGFMADQAQKAITLAQENPVDFRAIAMGEKNAPRGLTNESVFATAKKLAMEAGDTQTLIDLSKSKVATQASIKGQEIKSLDVLEPNVNDPVKILQDIRSGNEARYEKQTGKKVAEVKEKIVKEIRKEIKSRAPTKKSWEDFIEQIKCSY